MRIAGVPSMEYTEHRRSHASMVSPNAGRQPGVRLFPSKLRGSSGLIEAGLLGLDELGEGPSGRDPLAADAPDGELDDAAVRQGQSPRPPAIYRGRRDPFGRLLARQKSGRNRKADEGICLNGPGQATEKKLTRCHAYLRAAITSDAEIIVQVSRGVRWPWP